MLEMRSVIYGIKHKLNEINGRTDITEEKIHVLEIIALETIKN